MEHIRDVMRVIDENCHNLPEGDYLTLCNSLRKIFNDKDEREWSTLVDYEVFDIYTPGQTDDILDHFHDHFYMISVQNEEAFLRMQLDYLEDELLYNQPIKRITKYVKSKAINEYCNLHNITLNVRDEEHLRKYLEERNENIGRPGVNFEKAVRVLYRSYISIENTYRDLYSRALKGRIRKIYNWFNRLDELYT
jgi:hypothetical protein